MAAAVACEVDLNAAASAARATPTAVAAATAAAPLFPGRPDFPRGLNVLLIDDAGAACCGAARAQLEQLGYEVAVLPAHALATDPAQMRQQLLQQQSEPQPGSFSPAGGALFDVVLADLPTTAAAAGDGGVRALAAATGAVGVPLVLMGARCGAAQVMEGVDAGAADFLERPLSSLKLQNLWQHAVRRAMAARRPCASADAAAGAAGARRRLTLKRCGSSAAPCGAVSVCAAAWPDGGADEHAPAVSSPYGCGAAASPCGPSLDEEDELEALVFGSLDCDMDHPTHLAGADLAAAACDALCGAAPTPAHARAATLAGAGAGPALLLPGTPSADCSGGMSLEDSLEDSWCCDGPFGGGGGSGAGLRGGAAHALTAAALDELELGLRCGAPRPSQLMRLDSF
ncbi:hypothetical protein MNEG_13612 [Monoraphidium neglectum]|uniref:Response regulatory domain-containing protein n=1 Tax=Monoraphidium neglectum TaxID=145388 RepID=A0A0D2LRP0_9CHLO|nr:hypothetical protein MNEG_13612 [Monoraphidium neglectum]KIY94349.1 hypothetical protein MNEG_13612 [Monoraphidium neglectum]|eukprot:XP_013893369.1 hypothetical protein MNEG_13612 [Monoraphidium neglectum]